jgi:SAM-dependent methyltransferase
MSAPSLQDLRELYARNVNIMGWLREVTGQQVNSAETILISYDLQTGSYTEALKRPEHRARLEGYAGEIAEVIDALGGAASLLEAGIGEATTLALLLPKLARRPATVAGFDISWSRISYARKLCGEHGLAQVRLCTGDMFSAPFVDGAVDVLYTSHAVEPNHGREREVLHELYRVARRYLVLVEPSYELGNEATRARILKHGYCRGLPEIAAEAGWKIAEHRLLRHQMTERNQSALLVIEKPAGAAAAAEALLGCPLCHAALREIRGQWFCEPCARIYPVVDGVPCLLPGQGILGSKFPESP